MDRPLLGVLLVLDGCQCMSKDIERGLEIRRASSDEEHLCRGFDPFPSSIDPAFGFFIRATAFFGRSGL